MLFSVMCAGYSAIHRPRASGRRGGDAQLIRDSIHVNYLPIDFTPALSVAFGGLKVEDLESAKRPNLGTLPDSIITVGFFYILKML